MDSKRSALTEKDIQEAREQLESFFQMMTAAGKKLGGETTITQSENNDDYMEVRLREGHEIRGKSVIKIKTVFHSVEESLEDRHGGIFKCSYNIRKTVAELYERVIANYPHATVYDIQSIADERKISFDEAKKSLAFSIAEAEFWIRIKIARFIHEQLKPTMDVVLNDLLEDAFLYGLSEYGYKLANPKQFEKIAKGYIQFRKKRTNLISGVGKRGKSSVSTEEISEFINKSLAKMQELDGAGKKITPNAVARKIIGINHSNPLKAFKDKLQKYGFTFEDLKEELTRLRSEQKNR
jgi:hypothetical protein